MFLYQLKIVYSSLIERLQIYILVKIFRCKEPNLLKSFADWKVFSNRIWLECELCLTFHLYVVVTTHLIQQREISKDKPVKSLVASALLTADNDGIEGAAEAPVLTALKLVAGHSTCMLSPYRRALNYSWHQCIRDVKGCACNKMCWLYYEELSCTFNMCFTIVRRHWKEAHANLKRHIAKTSDYFVFHALARSLALPCRVEVCTHFIYTQRGERMV